MSEPFKGRIDIPAAEPGIGYRLAIDDAIANLRRAVNTARDHGVDLSPEQDRAVRFILTA
jgi:hypothetical protein